MSCTEVLYQPYAAHPYQGKHPIYQPEKRYSPKRNYSSSSSERESTGGIMSFKSPSFSGQNAEDSSVFQLPAPSSYQPTSKKLHPQDSCLFSSSVSQKNVSSCRFDGRAELGQTSMDEGASASTSNSSHNDKHAPFGQQTQNNGISPTSSISSSDGDLARRLSPRSELSSCRIQSRKTPSAQRVSPRCVMFTYFDGSTDDEVDGHFTRALSDETSSSKDGSSPMIKRNFPPSFWNSEYQPPPTNRRFPIGFNAGTALSSLIPGARAQPNPFSHTASPPFLTLDRLAPNFDPYSSSCNFTGFQSHLQHPAIGDPWNAYAGLSSSISGHSSYSHRALNAVGGMSDFYGLSAAAVAAAASRSLDQRYNSLLLQPSAGLRAAAGLSAARSSSVGKESHLWPVARYSGLRF